MALLILVGGRHAAAESGEDPLKNISLEALTTLQVTSVAKKEQPLWEAPSAVFVITRDDIRRTGATSVPELLRMVPGLSVARIDNNKWAVSSRGFNGRFANKMLVLRDGRSLYTPLFAGVYWDVQDLVLEDIDRIEVIRGPGATLWGANAVNGVINIMTRHTHDTQGTLVTVGSGSEERGAVSVRHGGGLGARASYRVYGKYFNRQSLTDDGREAPDRWNLFRSGVRTDWRPSPDDAIRIETEMYSGTAGETYTPFSILPLVAAEIESRTALAGGHVLGRWTRGLSRRSDLSVQAYYDRARRDGYVLGETRETFDVEVQHHAGWRRRHDLVWGGGYRFTRDRTHPSAIMSLAPDRRGSGLFNLFVQNETALAGDRVRVTGGTKIEHNDFTGWELQPGVRVAWVPDARQTLWASASRALRTPSRAESDIRIDTISMPGPQGLPVLYSLLGNRDFEPEALLAHEVGYRIQPASRVSLDLAAFHNRHEQLRTFEPGAPMFEGTPTPRIVLPLWFDNEMSGRTYGAELAASAAVAPNVSMTAAYTRLHVRLRRYPGSGDTIGWMVEDDSPVNQISVRSLIALPRQFELHTWLARVDELKKQGVPAYTRLDARLAWRPVAPVDASLVLQNLLGDRLEFSSTLGELPTYVRRGAFARVSFRF